MTSRASTSLPIGCDAEILGGEPVFVGTRGPVRTIFDYLADGCTIAEFLKNFPSVGREDALAVLAASGEGLLINLKRQ